MDFLTPNIYGMLEKGIPMRIEKMGRVFELPTLIIPVGSTVYRADAGGAKSPSNSVPAFFSNDQSITVYKRGNDRNVSKYRTTRDVRLFLMTIQSLKVLFAFHPDLTPDDKQYMMIYLQKQSEGAVLPIYPTGDRYLNRTIANIVCRLGFDGWIVQPFVEGKSGMLNYSMLRDNILPYKPEVMICRWTECMERIFDGGKKLTRRQKGTRRSRGTRGT